MYVYVCVFVFNAPHRNKTIPLVLGDAGAVLYTYMYMCVYKYTYIYIYVCVCVCVYVYIYICVCVCVQRASPQQGHSTSAGRRRCSYVYICACVGRQIDR